MRCVHTQKIFFYIPSVFVTFSPMVSHLDYALPSDPVVLPEIDTNNSRTGTSLSHFVLDTPIQPS